MPAPLPRQVLSSRVQGKMDSPHAHVKELQAQSHDLEDWPPCPIERKNLHGLRIDLTLTVIRWSQYHVCGSRSSLPHGAARTSETIQPSRPFTTSPALLALESEKREKYARLMAVASRQHSEGRRPSRPKFFPLVFSGYMAPDAVSTIISKFKTKIKATVPRPDGFTAKELTSKFAIMCHVAEGMGI